MHVSCGALAPVLQRLKPSVKVDLPGVEAHQRINSLLIKDPSEQSLLPWCSPEPAERATAQLPVWCLTIRKLGATGPSSWILLPARLHQRLQIKQSYSASLGAQEFSCFCPLRRHCGNPSGRVRLLCSTWSESQDGRIWKIPSSLKPVWNPHQFELFLPLDCYSFKRSFNLVRIGSLYILLD